MKEIWHFFLRHMYEIRYSRYRRHRWRGVKVFHYLKYNLIDHLRFHKHSLSFRVSHNEGNYNFKLNSLESEVDQNINFQEFVVVKKLF